MIIRVEAKCLPLNALTAAALKVKHEAKLYDGQPRYGGHRPL